MLNTYFSKKSTDLTLTQERKCLLIATNATKKDIKIIAEIFKIEAESISEALDDYESPRLERLDHAYSLYLRIPIIDSDILYTHAITLIFDEQTICIVSIGSPELIKRIVDKTEAYDLKKILTTFLDEIATEYMKKIKKTTNQVQLGRKSIKEVSSFDIEQLIETEEILNQYSTALKPTQTILSKLSEIEELKFTKSEKIMFDNAFFTFNQASDVCYANLISLSNLRDSYQIIFTNKLNKILRFFASISIILTIPTIVGGFFGTNFHYLPFKEHPLGFFVIVIGSITASLFVLMFFIKKRWI